ncbi:hypothetical protein pb186bvf_015975 [Paramecium bursaria]
MTSQIWIFKLTQINQRNEDFIFFDPQQIIKNYELLKQLYNLLNLINQNIYDQLDGNIFNQRNNNLNTSRIKQMNGYPLFEQIIKDSPDIFKNQNL